MKQDFCIVNTSFNLLAAFKEEVEQMGYEYITSFCDFTASSNPDLYFGNFENFTKNKNGFALSNRTNKCMQFILPLQWNEAIEFAKQNITEEPVYELVTSLDDLYTQLIAKNIYYGLKKKKNVYTTGNSINLLKVDMGNKLIYKKV